MFRKPFPNAENEYIETLAVIDAVKRSINLTLQRETAINKLILNLSTYQKATHSVTIHKAIISILFHCLEDDPLKRSEYIVDVYQKTRPRLTIITIPHNGSPGDQNHKTSLLKACDYHARKVYEAGITYSQNRLQP